MSGSKFNLSIIFGINNLDEHAIFFNIATKAFYINTGQVGLLLSKKVYLLFPVDLFFVLFQLTQICLVLLVAMFTARSVQVSETNSK